MHALIPLIALWGMFFQGENRNHKQGDEVDVRKAVVKILATKRHPDLDRPWNKHPAGEVAGSGVVVEGNRILTSAHIVLYASNVMIQPHPSGEMIPAKVAALAPSIDLAVLKVEDESFFRDHPPLKIEGTLPRLQDPVNVYGYPLGGTGMSITQGIVSRIEFGGAVMVRGPIPLRLDSYAEPTLHIQIDAALNAGNSGGPALANGRMIGIVQSVLPGAQKIGYLLASEEISAFLKETATREGTYTGKPQFFEEWQPLENRAIRKRLGLGKDTKGIMVRKTASRETEYPLKEWDVITRIGDHEIDNGGMVSVEENLRLRFDYFFSKLANGDSVPLTIVRAGEPTQIALPVRRERNSVLRSLKGRYPSYFVFGPMVFSAATSEYVDGSGPVWWGLWADLGSPLITRRSDETSFAGEELVVVAAQLPHQITSGYANRYAQVVTHVNDCRIRNLRHLVETLRDSQDRFLVFRFAEVQAETLVFEREEASAATETILEDNGIRQRGSDEMLEVWRTRGAR